MANKNILSYISVSFNFRQRLIIYNYLSLLFSRNISFWCKTKGQWSLHMKLVFLVPVNKSQIILSMIKNKNLVKHSFERNAPKLIHWRISRSVSKTAMSPEVVLKCILAEHIAADGFNIMVQQVFHCTCESFHWNYTAEYESLSFKYRRKIIMVMDVTK